jgi:hypothetical protein
MRPQTIGRVLGIGLRVAGHVASEQLSGSGSAAMQQPSAAGNPAAAQDRAAALSAARSAGRASRGVARGLGGFIRPFTRVGGILWLEITGAFFLLFGSVFAMRLWQNWTGFAKTPITRNLVLAAALVFLYLGVSAFWRAHRR